MFITPYFRPQSYPHRRTKPWVPIVYRLPTQRSITIGWSKMAPAQALFLPTHIQKSFTFIIHSFLLKHLGFFVMKDQVLFFITDVFIHKYSGGPWQQGAIQAHCAPQEGRGPAHRRSRSGRAPPPPALLSHYILWFAPF